VQVNSHPYFNKVSNTYVDVILDKSRAIVLRDLKVGEARGTILGMGLSYEVNGQTTQLFSTRHFILT